MLFLVLAKPVRNTGIHELIGGTAMKSFKSNLLVTITLFVTPLLLGSLAAAQDEDSGKVKWKEVIGIIQAGNVVGSGTGKVAGGGQPWSTTEGKAHVNLTSGKIEFEVHGLVLAGGNSIGTRDAINQVKGTLVCDTDGSAGGGNSVVVDTELVPLSAQGDAHFSGDIGTLPGACFEPDIAFLIRIAAGRWIANGSVRTP